MQELVGRAADPAGRPCPGTCAVLKEAGLVRDHAEGTRRLYRLHDEGLDAVRSYLEGVWGETAARFRLAAENTADRREGGRP